MVRRLLEAGANPNGSALKARRPMVAPARQSNRRRTLLAKNAKRERHSRGASALIVGGGAKHATWSGAARARCRHSCSLGRLEQVMAVSPHGSSRFNRAIPHGGDTP